MVTTNYISLNSIFSSLLRNNLMKGISPSDIAEYTIEALSFMGVPAIYEDAVETIDIKDYRGELPCDILYIQQTRRVSKVNKTLTPMRYSTSSFSSAYHEIGSPDIVTTTEIGKDLYYSLNNGMIYTSFERGKLQMSFKRIKTDEEGFPMIPEHKQFSRAIEAYIKMKWYEIQWEMGKLPDKVLARADQEYTWAVGAAQNYGQLQSIDQAESFKNSMTKLIGNSLTGSKYFTDLGRKEFLRRGSI